MLSRKRQLAVKVESTKGVAETLTVTDMLIECEAIEPSYQPAEIPRPIYSDTLGSQESVVGAPIATLRLVVELKGSGTAGTAPVIGTLLKGCGMVETDGSSSVAYSFSSDDDASDTLTMWAFLDGVIFKLYGARGTPEFPFQAGSPTRVTFTFTGIYGGVVSGAMLEPTYPDGDILPPVWKDAQLEWNFGEAYTTVDLDTLSLAFNNTVVVRGNANAASGLDYARITNREPGGQVDPDAVLVSAQDWAGYLGTPTTGTLSFRQGSTAGNIVEFEAVKFQVMGLVPGARDDILTWSMGYKLRKSAGDDELTITFL